MADQLITLGDLAFAFHAYDSMTRYGRSLRAFQGEFGEILDLADPAMRMALLRWLNSWGCRNLTRADHGLASANLATWWTMPETQLPDQDASLEDLEEKEVAPAAEVFQALAELAAATKPRKGRTLIISFGPTAASKTLFVLRPHTFAPWDAPIRRKLKYDGSGASYVQYLKRIRGGLIRLADQCAGVGFGLEELPARLQRPGSTPAQLFGEYYWTTITRRLTPPGRETLREWADWS